MSRITPPKKQNYHHFLSVSEKKKFLKEYDEGKKYAGLTKEQIAKSLKINVTTLRKIFKSRDEILKLTEERGNGKIKSKRPRKFVV